MKHTPNWFASVMGTGIIAVAANSLPVQFPGLHTAGRIVWILASIMLITLCFSFRKAESYVDDSSMCHFYGAPAMAFMTVGNGFLIYGGSWGVAVDWVLFGIGTTMGLGTAIIIPMKAFMDHTYKQDAAFGGWLMAVVPPMVSASSGGLLIPHTPAGQVRETLLWCCYGCFGLSLLASVIIISLIWNKLFHWGIGARATVPTYWIILGPLGQSITAVNILGGNAHLIYGNSWADGLFLFGIIYGAATLGFALLWTAIAGIITLRTLRMGMPFNLTWWSFTFPVGTVTTGLSGLYAHTGLYVFGALACIYYLGLVLVWVRVLSSTASIVFTKQEAQTIQVTVKERV
ncbi:MAG: TDT family transporter [Corynebacterium sp.]|nr:TDT family transporter [Corynebacterium sp.]